LPKITIQNLTACHDFERFLQVS